MTKKKKKRHHTSNKTGNRLYVFNTLKTDVQNSPEMGNSEMPLEVILFQASNKTGQKQILN